jgi:hypothetical protein
VYSCVYSLKLLNNIGSFIYYYNLLTNYIYITFNQNTHYHHRGSHFILGQLRSSDILHMYHPRTKYIFNLTWIWYKYFQSHAWKPNHFDIGYCLNSYFKKKIFPTRSVSSMSECPFLAMETSYIFLFSAFNVSMDNAPLFCVNTMFLRLVQTLNTLNTNQNVKMYYYSSNMYVMLKM